MDARAPDPFGLFEHGEHVLRRELLLFTRATLRDLILTHELNPAGLDVAKLTKAQHFSGIGVAYSFGMDSHAAFEAVMECPRCSHEESPAEDSSHVIAWYQCARCGYHWSARLRAGRPAPVQPLDIPDLHARSG